MIISYLKLGIATLLPVLVAVLIYLAEKYADKVKFLHFYSALGYWPKQIIFGVIFGGIAVIGTEWGIPMNGAQVNCRDAAVLIAGLMFGGPAGIIAGFIGGIERFVAVWWGVGEFTQIACSVSTIIAGFYAAAIRKFMCDDKKPNWLLALAAGIVMEVFHLTMVFITNMDQTDKAMAVVKACTVPMVIANGVSVMLAAFVLAAISHELFNKKQSQVRISQTIQRWLLVTVAVAFTLTSYFVFSMQNTIANTQTDASLQNALDDTAANIADASDRNLLSITREVVSDYYQKGQLLEEIIGDRYKTIIEINIVDANGIITKSTVPENVGYNMASGVQSAEFLWLLDNEVDEYIQAYGPISKDSTKMRKYAGKKCPKNADGDCFLQVGCTKEQLEYQVTEQLTDVARNSHVSDTGYILVFDHDRNLISCPRRIEQNILANDIKSVEIPDELGVTFEASLNGEDNFCRCSTIEGYYILSVLPREEALQMRNVALYVNTFMEILVFAIMFALIYQLIKRVVVNQIKSINSSLDKITDGDLDEVVDVRSNAEFASLSDDINSTVATLKRYIDEASARIDAELEFAKNIQSSALPNVFPAFPKRKDFDIHALMCTAKEVGGDFYDFYMTDNNTLNFLVADVSGKGIPAAMFMMRAKTELKSLTEADNQICDVFTHGNAALCEGNDAGMFVTAWQGGLNLETGLVKYANAGHNPPLVKHADGSCEYLRTKVGFVLAGMDGVRYKTQELQLQKGDVVFLYTDGVTEATNSENQLYGESRLKNLLESFNGQSMKELCTAVKADVDLFVGEAPQFDDITMVALKYNGKPDIPTIRFENAQTNDVTAVTEFVEAELEKLDCPLKKQMQIDVAIDEIFSNIVKHGYKGKGGEVTVEVIAEDDPRGVSLRFTDSGVPFNPLTNASPDISLSAEERQIGGLGIYMVKQTMDDITYKYENEKNILTLKCLF